MELLQFGAVGVLAILAVGGAVYAYRRYEAQTNRFIEFLQKKSEEDRTAARQQAEAAMLMASAGERQAETNVAVAKQLEILTRAVDDNTHAIREQHR